MNSSGVKETLRSSDGVDAEGGRTSVVTGSVSDSPLGTSEYSDIGLVGNTLSLSGAELSITLVYAGGALVSVASVARGQRM